MAKTFRDELMELVNKHSRENESDTPDFVLAQFIIDSLFAFDQSVKMREKWYGRVKDDDEGTGEPDPADGQDPRLVKRD